MMVMWIWIDRTRAPSSASATSTIGRSEDDDEDEGDDRDRTILINFAKSDPRSPQPVGFFFFLTHLARSLSALFDCP
jgi:hypothetical protein